MEANGHIERGWGTQAAWTRSELRISPVVFGAADRRGAEPSARERLVLDALELGLTTIDTAPLYEFGDSERWVGRALRGRRRDGVVLCSKVGLRWVRHEGAPEATKRDILFSVPTPTGEQLTVWRDSRPKVVRHDVEESLKRLGVDYIDLIQVHHVDRFTPIEDTIDELLTLKREGKVGHIGLCNYTLDDVKQAVRALGTTPLAALQLPYSLVERAIETDLLPWAVAHGVRVLAYRSLAEGVLAGMYSGARPPRALDSHFRHRKNAGPITREVDRVLRPIARRHEVEVGAVALAWVRGQAAGISPIVGASKRQHLEVAGAAAHLRLTPSERMAVRQALAIVDIDPRPSDRLSDVSLRMPGRALAKAKSLVGKVAAVLRAGQQPAA